MTKFWMVWNPDGCNPTCRHDDEPSALREAERLAGRNPGEKFFVLEALTVSQYKAVSTTRLGRTDDMAEEIPF